MSYVYIFQYNHSLIKKYQPDLLHLATSFFPGWGFLWGNWHWCLHSCGICWTKSFWWSAFRQHSKSWLSCCGMNYRVYMYLIWLFRIWPRVIMLSNYLYYLTPDKEKNKMVEEFCWLVNLRLHTLGTYIWWILFANYGNRRWFF